MQRYCPATAMLPRGAQGIPSDLLFIDIAISCEPDRSGCRVRMVRIPYEDGPLILNSGARCERLEVICMEGSQYDEVWVRDHVVCARSHCMPQCTRTLPSPSYLLAKATTDRIESSPQPVHHHSSNSPPSSNPLNPSSTTHAFPSSGLDNASHARPTTSRPGGRLPSSSIASTTLASVVRITL